MVLNVFVILNAFHYMVLYINSCADFLLYFICVALNRSLF